MTDHNGTSVMVTEALGSARVGWRVLPVNGKAPLLKDWPTRATTDETLIREWWRQHPAANIGLATGQQSNLLVLDIDPAKGGDDSLRSLEDTFGALPPTVEVVTGGGGRHVYFQYPGNDIGNSASRLGPGLDIKTDGGMVVAPPSIHPITQRAYAWEAAHHPNDVQLAAVPAWLLAQLTVPKGPGAPFVAPETIGDGARNDTLFRAARSMKAKNFGRQAIADAIRAENTTKCTPPLPDEEVARIIEHAWTQPDHPAFARHGKPDDPSHTTGTAPDHGDSAFPLTDSGNAEWFAASVGASVRYDHCRARWLLWRQHRWQADADAEIHRRAKAAIRHRFEMAATLDDLDARRALAKWALGSESRTRLEASLTLAQAEHPIADAGDHWDRNPVVLGVPNGVIDLRTGQLRDGLHDDRITMNSTTPFESVAACPRWEQFVQEIFDGDTKLTAFIQRAIGYSLTGDTSEQCLFLCYGVGANGKGTLVNTLLRVLGDYAWNMPFSTIELHQRAAIPNDLAALVGRRFVVASETNDGTRLNESRVKALTGCDPLTARFLHGEFFTFEPVAKFWLAVNHKPVVRDDSHGFWRRIRLIPFMRQFAVNPTLADELRGEAPGILAWAVRGCLAWQQEGLNPPESVTDATTEYQEESDVLAAFLDEACEVAVEAETKAKDLYDHYAQWADGHGLNDRERLTSTMFGRKMSERFSHDRTRAGKVYKGVSRRSV